MEVDGAPVIKTETACIEDFEKVVYGREYEKAVEELRKCCKALKHGLPFSGRLALDQTDYTRMAGAIAALFSDPNFKLSQNGFNVLCNEYSTFDALFKASGLWSSEYTFGLIREDAQCLTKHLLLFPMDSSLNLDLESAFRKDPQATVGLWLAMLAHPQVFSEKADERRERLLNLSHVFKDVELPQEVMNVLVGAYMHCSYAHGRGKHAPKRVMHKLLKRMMEKDISPRLVPIVPKKRPTVLVALEWWWTRHAMYRIYAHGVKQLGEHFRIVGMARNENTNEEARAMFDEFHVLPDDKIILVEIADKIKEIAPDVIYYPSIGMTAWTIAMASLRLAPLQVMSYGHPATTHSPEIDYGFIEEEMLGNTPFSEFPILLPSDAHRYTSRKWDGKKHIPKRGERLKIAVPAMHCKVSWPFVRALQEIERRAPREVEFHFFPYVGGAGMLQFGRQMEPLLQHKVICEKAEYEEYMSWIAECDLALFSFPFGGTNSTIDAALLGMPMIAFEGEEIHSKTDALVMRRLGLPEWMIAKNEEEYVEKVLSLFDDDLRAKAAADVCSSQIANVFTPDEKKTFLAAFLKVYNSHMMKEAA